MTRNASRSRKEVAYSYDKMDGIPCCLKKVLENENPIQLIVRKEGFLYTKGIQMRKFLKTSVSDNERGI